MSGSWSVFYQIPYKAITLATTDTLLRIEMGSGGFNLGNISILEHIPTSVTDRPAGKLVVFPVPVKDFLYINCPEGSTPGNRLPDLSGRVLYSNRPKSSMENPLTVYFESFPAGMYVVSLNRQE